MQGDKDEDEEPESIHKKSTIIDGLKNQMIIAMAPDGK